MIGFYDYTVVLTYIGFCSGVTGIFCASMNYVRWSVFFWLYLVSVICLMGRLRGQRRTGLMKRKASESKSIRLAIWFVSAYFLLLFALNWG